MNDITTLLTDFLATPAGLAVKALLVGTVVTFALGVVAALRDKTFDFQYIDSFVRSTLLGRVIPVAIVLGVGYVADEQSLLLFGAGAAGTVGAGMVASAIESIRQLTMTPVVSATRNAPPVA